MVKVLRKVKEWGFYVSPPPNIHVMRAHQPMLQVFMDPHQDIVGLYTSFPANNADQDRTLSFSGQDSSAVRAPLYGRFMHVDFNRATLQQQKRHISRMNTPILKTRNRRISQP